MTEGDVAVVGGGPAGALAAWASAKRGAKTVLLERAPHAKAACAGLVSPETAEALAVPQNLILREIVAVRIFSPKGKIYEIRAEKPKGLVLDRTGLNRWLRGQAEKAGAEVLPAEALAIRGKTLVTKKEEVEFGVLIGADGARSFVAKALGLPSPGEILVGIQAETRAELGDTVEVHFGIVPEFFAWAVPAEEGVCRVGLATNFGRKAIFFLRNFLATRFPHAEILRVRAGLIPIGPPAQTAEKWAILVGNAAGQVKPLTGGGLAFIARCAPLAGEMAAQGEKALAEYEKAWRKLIGEELEFGLRGRQVFLKLSPADLEQILGLLAQRKMARFLAEEGEIDHLSLLPRKLLRRPDLWPLLGPLTRWLTSLCEF